MLRLAFDFIITWRETRTRPNAYERKPKNSQLYIKTEYPIKSIYITVFKHFMQHSASQYSEGIRA